MIDHLVAQVRRAKNRMIADTVQNTGLLSVAGPSTATCTVLLWMSFGSSAVAQLPTPDPLKNEVPATAEQTSYPVGRKDTAQEKGVSEKCVIQKGADLRGERSGRDEAPSGVQLPPGVRVLRDLEYARTEGQSLQLDLYLPEETDNDNRLPLLVWLHGSDWTTGDAERINPLFVELVPHGYAIASIAYRLVGPVRHPHQVEDVKGAIRWLRAQDQRFGYDGTRIGLGGNSTGGHLALLAGLTNGHKALEGDTGGNPNLSSRVDAVVALFPPGNSEVLAASKAPFARNKTREPLRAASPVTYVDPGDPPLLILHGEGDSEVELEQSRLLHERYKLAGLVSNLHVLEGAGHGDREFRSARTKELVREFLDLHLRPEQLDSGQPLQLARTEEPMRGSPTKASSDQASTSPVPPMHGFHWMIGPRKGLGGTDEAYERLLAEVDKTLSENSCITGVFVIQHWNLLEPAPGDFRFERLDRLLSLIRKHGRYFKLAVTPGIYSPEWLYTKGSEGFETLGSNPSRRHIYQRKVRIPVPWDDHYQRYYYRLLEEVARRYGADPAFRAITVTVAAFMSAEWHLPRSTQDRQRWKAFAGFPERLERVWKDGIDRFATLFPKQMLVLHASSYPLGLKDLGDSVVDHGVTRYPERFAVQINQLMGRFDQMQRPTYRKLLDYRRRYGDRISIGLQNLSGWGFPQAAKEQGSLEMTAYNFAQAHGEYWELWYGDGKNLSTCQALRSHLEKVREKGLTASRRTLEDNNQYMPDPGPGRPRTD